jgi:DNA-binding PadR family transcriptional regulator
MGDIPNLSDKALLVLKVFLDNPGAQLAGIDILKATALASGTLYPILLRFERLGLLESTWESEAPSLLKRPRRRLYTITAEGAAVGTRALRQLSQPVSLRLADALS